MKTKSNHELCRKGSTDLSCLSRYGVTADPQAATNASPFRPIAGIRVGNLAGGSAQRVVRLETRGRRAARAVQAVGAALEWSAKSWDKGKVQNMAKETAKEMAKGRSKGSLTEVR